MCRVDHEEEVGTKQRWEEGQSCTQVGHCEGQDKPVGIGLQARSSDDEINYRKLPLISPRRS